MRIARPAGAAGLAGWEGPPDVARPNQLLSDEPVGQEGPQLEPVPEYEFQG